ncbi:MAG: hypothetical protein KKE43_05800, partial [Actinobacteria bacterium]|nr:hypothetical protein [Actinomycetota bacterium]MBU4301146.1 hypothetical protein [Actinomycetota bacterium]
MAVITGRPDVPEGLFDRVLSLLELVERLPDDLSTPFHKYACIRTSMHPHLPRSAPSRYSRSTARSRALHERRLGALDT